MEYIVITDVGTTSIKTTLFDERLSLLASASGEYKISAQKNGYIELSPKIYWDYFCRGLKAVCTKSNIPTKLITRLAFTTQGETFIPVDGKCKPLANAMVWLDTRAVKEAEQVARTVDADEFFKLTGVADINATCPISKLIWVKNNAPDVYAGTRYFLLLEDYLIARLTGRFVSEKSLMSTTGYYDIYHDRVWDDVLREFGLDVEKIPEVLECGTTVGPVLPSVASLLELNQDAVVVTGAMDQITSALGSGNVRTGMITETTGTALTISATCGKDSLTSGHRVTIYKHALPDRYLYLPVCMTGGMLLKWFKDEFCIAERDEAGKKGVSVYDIMNDCAQKSPPLSNGILILPYLNGTLQPHFNPNARGVFFGIGLENTRADFVRAIFEAVAFMLLENVEMLKTLGGIEPTELRSCGGGSRSELWTQIKADVLDLDTYSMLHAETSSIGAAVLAMLPLNGEEGMLDLLATANPREKKYLPHRERVGLYQKGYERYSSLYQSVKGMF
jgi:Sugar (pentulose and hexulose) kinases